MVKGRDRNNVLAYADATWEGSSRGGAFFWGVVSGDVSDLRQFVGVFMRRFRVAAVAALFVVAAATPAQPQIALPSALQILGSVTNAARPVANALVIALHLN